MCHKSFDSTLLGILQFLRDTFQKVDIQDVRNADKKDQIDVFAGKDVVDIGTATRKLTGKPCNGTFLTFHFLLYHLTDMKFHLFPSEYLPVDSPDRMNK